MPKKREKARARKKAKARRARRTSPAEIAAFKVSPSPVAGKKDDKSEVSTEIDALLKDDDGVKKELERLEEKELSLEQGEAKIQRQGREIQKEEKKIEEEARKIIGIEEDIKKSVTIKPLGKVTARDLNKGIIGAFFGTIAHFAFIYGKEIAQQITNTRATVLYIFSYFLLILLMYKAGYREIEEKKYLELFPLRATLIYFLSICVVIVVFILYNQLDSITLGTLYRQVSVVSVLAVLGAGTADMLGRE